MRIAIAGRIARQPILSALAEMADVEPVEFDSVAQVATEVPGLDAVILSDPRGPDGAVLAAALRRPDARTSWVHVVSAGYGGMLSHPLPDHLAITNGGGAAAPAVAEHALALILACNRQLALAAAAQAAHRWDNAPIRPGLRTLEGSTVTIVGMGHVGLALAQRLQPFGVTLIGVTRSGAALAGLDRTFAISEIEAALSIADVVVLALPGAPDTRHLMDAARLGAMKPGALLVNVGRGTVVDSAALTDALVRGQLAGAALDVTDPEPLPSHHPLWRAPNIVITPHIAGGGSHLTGKRIADVIVANVERFQRGAPLLHQIYPGGRS